MHRQIALPDIDVAAGIRGGRSPREGYQRGWGLQFGGLKAAVTADPLYKKALRAAGGRTIVEEAKLANLFLLVTVFLRDLDAHNVVEFGVFRGGSTLFLATLLSELYPRARVFALDTFAGMPETDRAVDAHKRGDFRDADLPGLRARTREVGLDNIEFLPGLFEDTFPALVEGNVRFGLAHIDCDIYSAVKYSQDAVWERMAKGGYLVFDDATMSSCIGATQAVEELIMDRRLHSEQVWPHVVFRAGL